MKYFDQKLYRKFLILAVLLGGLFAVSSSNHATATTCCTTCDTTYRDCANACGDTYAGSPVKIAWCISTYCEEPYNFCLTYCDPGC